MYASDKVKIDVALVEAFIKRKGITKGKFSEMMGHNDNWWHGIKRNGGIITPNKAKLICTVLGMSYDQLVIPDRTTSNAYPGNEQKPLYADDQSVQAMVNSLNRLENGMNRLEIQMRVLLKELGVK